VSDQYFQINPFSATANCGAYDTKWTYTRVDNSDGHLLEIGSDFMKVDSETGSIMVS
jgi:hypothetical protein